MNWPSQAQALNTQPLVGAIILKHVNKEFRRWGLARGSRSTRGGSLKVIPTSGSRLFSLLSVLLGCKQLT